MDKTENCLKTIEIPLLKKVMIYTFIFGLIAHGYCYFNADYSHDSLTAVHEQSAGFMISVGRYLRPLYEVLFGSFAVPALTGFVELLFLGIAIYCLLDALRIRSKFCVPVACGILVTNASVSLLNATYIHDAGAYALSLMLVSIGVWITLARRNGIWYSMVFYFLSLGFYQAYIDVAIFALLIIAALDVLDGQGWKEAWKKLFSRLAVVAASMILYFVVYKILLQVTGITEFSQYDNSVSKTYDFASNSIIERLYTAAQAEAIWFTSPSTHLAYLVCLLNVICLLAAVYFIIRIARANRIGTESAWVLVVTLLMMPAGTCLIILASNMCHELMIYSFQLFYIFVLALAEKSGDMQSLSENRSKEIGKRIVAKVVLVVLLIVILENCVYSNEVYLRKHLEYEATFSVMTRIVDRIEQTEGYEPGKTEVAIVGRLQDSPIKDKKEGLPEGAGLWGDYSVTYYLTYERYLKEIFNYNINIVSEAESDSIAQKQDVKDMNCFPDRQAVQMVDGVLVVKLSETGDGTEQ